MKSCLEVEEWNTHSACDEFEEGGLASAIGTNQGNPCVEVKAKL